MNRKHLKFLWLLPGVLLMLPFLFGTGPVRKAGLTSKVFPSGLERKAIKTVGYFFKAPEKAVNYVEGQVLVRFKDIPENRIEEVHRQLGTKVILESRMIPHLQLVKLPKNMDVIEAVKKFEKTGLVRYAEPNYIVTIEGTKADKPQQINAAYPNDPLVQIREHTAYGWTYQAACDPEVTSGGSDSDGFSYYTPMWQMIMPTTCTYLDPFICPSGWGCGGNNVYHSELHAFPCTDPMQCDDPTTKTMGAFTDYDATATNEVVILDIDTGIDYTHPDLAANVWINPNEIPANGLDDDGNGIVDDIHGIRAIGLGAEGVPACGGGTNFGDPMDDHGHGTHTAGTIAAVANNLAGLVGIGGLSNKVKVAGCKFLNTEGSGNTADAIVCMEYAYWLKTHGINLIATSNSWGGGARSTALKEAIKALQDVGVVTIAASGNAGADNDADPHYPSSYNLDGLVAVNSYNQHDCASGFSNYGEYSTDVFAPGSGIASTCPWALSNCSGDPNYNYVYYWGTSMATPHVSGLIGFLMTLDPNLTVWEARAIALTAIRQSSKDDATCAAVGASGDDVDSVIQATWQSYTDTTNPTSLTNGRIDLLLAAQEAVNKDQASTTPLQKHIFPEGDGPFMGIQGEPFVIRAWNANGVNFDPVTADISYSPPPTFTNIAAETFTGGFPASWSTNLLASDTCGVSWLHISSSTCARTPGTPFDADFVIADSDCYGSGCVMQTDLVTPVIDTSACTSTPGGTVLLWFDIWYNNISSDYVSVEVTTDGGATWTQVDVYTADTGYPTPTTMVYDITSIVAAGDPTQVQIRWVYDDTGVWAWYVGIDNFYLDCMVVTPPQPCGSVSFVDDGTGFDQVANDGIWAGSFTPGPNGECSALSAGAGVYTVELKDSGNNVFDTFQVFVNDTTSPEYGHYAFTDVTGTVSPSTSICGTGTALFTGSDDTTQDFTAGSTYPVMGMPFDTFCASSNGLVFPGLCPASSFPSNDALPYNAFGVPAALVPFWTDLDNVDVYWAENASDPAKGEPTLVIEYCNACPYGDSLCGLEAWNFRVVIGQNTGKIWFEYADTEGFYPNDYGAISTVGIQTNETHASQYGAFGAVAPTGQVLEASWDTTNGGYGIVTLGGKRFGYAPVGGSKSTQIEVKNIGYDTLTITNAVVIGNFSLSGLPTFPVTLNPGDSFTATWEFNPAFAGGDAGAAFFESSGGMFGVGGYGVGVGPNPDITIANPIVDFGTVTWGHTTTYDLPIQNDGFSDLYLSSFSPMSSTLSTSALPMTIAPASTDFLPITWTPQGCLDSTARLATNDPDESNVLLQFRGSVTIPDVPSTVGYYVERLVGNGITVGCGTEASIYGSDLNSDLDTTDKVYCPKRAVTRGEMAVFVGKSLAMKLGETVGTHVNCDADTLNDDNPFTDVPASHGACNYIYYLRDKGITTGCGASEYCPTSTMTRGQMAIFIAKAMNYPNAVPSYDGVYCGATGTSLFGDVSNTSPICSYVHDIYLNNVVAGCGGGNYCPTQSVTRGQMAVFIQKAFQLGCR